MKELHKLFFYGGNKMNKITWVNGQSGGTPLSAENLNLMQDNIEEAIDEKLSFTLLEEWED